MHRKVTGTGQGQWEVSEVEVRGKEAIRRLQRVEGFIYVDRGGGFRLSFTTY